MLAGLRAVNSRTVVQCNAQRYVSSSPYGRTHVWKRRKPVLPNPVVPTFPQKVILSDGSTYTHYTTSPRSTIRLTRDVTNNPLWNPSAIKGGIEEESETTGRLGRFSRKYEGLGEQSMDFYEELGASEPTSEPAKEKDK
ncbi:hypothetical protein SISSUDRAFT_987315 [Sistotremastrum suecicum HHB10207 ss-3]|uniref:Ribosomal protein bL31m N-terminal domain-containing protein n=1 Tax=Sistotremastrum suecicum HHB10207 ss-3 TaxID=1314776 RepID=A0A166CQ31_9AGAM|nr:hypothetical protein SISSUDRAFT_987315 [Sistotremastrum suecicum HHB10207 ss-3]